MIEVQGFGPVGLEGVRGRTLGSGSKGVRVWGLGC